MSNELKVTVELSPEIRVALASMASYYGKTESQVIEMALELFASQSKMVDEAVRAIAKGGKK